MLPKLPYYIWRLKLLYWSLHTKLGGFLQETVQAYLVWVDAGMRESLGIVSCGVIVTKEAE